MGQKDKLETTHSHYVFNLVAFVWLIGITIFMACAFFLTDWHTAGPNPQQTLLVMIVTTGIMAICSFVMFTQTFKKTVTRIYKKSETLEIKSFSFLKRHPEPYTMKWKEIKDVVIVPRPSGGPYGVWLVKHDRSLIHLKTYMRHGQAVSLRNEVAAFVGLSDSC